MSMNIYAGMFGARAGYADAVAGSQYAPNVSSEGTPSSPPRNGSVGVTRTMSLPHGAGVTFDRQHGVPSDDDIILVTVKLSNKERRQSYDDALPDRPRKRSFFRRMGTRILPPADEEKWKAVKMPRGEYKRRFQRDGEGNYIGSEPQQDWDEEDIKREYGMYQGMPIGSVVV